MKLYQNIQLEGETVTYESAKRQHSKFWNEGKWHTFIAPLLPADCTDMTFVEVGCNAGLFLKLAKERGFRHVVGIEANPDNVAYATRYRDQSGHDYKILQRTVGLDFDFDELPVADVTLLSNVHYYFDIQTWLNFLDRLEHRTQYCIIVSRKIRSKKDWAPSPVYSDIRLYFRRWREAGAVHDYHGKDMENDPAPRRMWSLLFESELRRRPVVDFDVGYYTSVGDTYRQLMELVLGGGDFDLKDTDYYKLWASRKGNEWDEAQTLEFVREKAELITDICDNGLKYPLVAHLYNRLADGRTRYGIMKELGYKSVMTRPL